jgi:formylglycine-generating enzyme required for sulfatase activity
MIPVACPQCGKALKVKDELAGKKVKCPSCGKPVPVPQLESVSPPPASRAEAKLNPEERILGPKAPPKAEDRAPSKSKSQTEQDSVADAGQHTDLGGRKGERTQASPEEGSGSELTDFLAPAEKPDELGRLGGFRILEILGHGGMGVVFQGEDPKLGRKVAIKAMLPHLAQSKSSHERFLREAKAAAALEHDHIVTIHHVGEDRGAPFIVMPFLQGEPLDARLKRRKVLAIPEVIRIGRETAKGLAAAHKRGLIHRDIKPANLWLEGEEGRVKILDFGLARATSETGLTQTGAIIGTPQYMAPEQAAGRKNIDHRCDLFSLGCVLYRMCTGRVPFEGEDTLAIISALAMEQPKEPSKVKKEVPAELSNLIMHLLAKKPEDRPQSAQEVVDALAELSGKDTAQQATLPMAAPKGGKTTLLRPPKSSASRRRLVVAAALVLLAGVGGLAIFLGSGKTDPNKQTENKGQQPALPGDGTLPPTFTNNLGMEFVLVPKGKFLMGGGDGKPGTKEVEIAHDFYLGKYEVTQEEWEKVMGNNPSFYSRTNIAGKEVIKRIPDGDLKRFPVEAVSWDDAQLFLEELNKREKQAGWAYRLPMDAEWEYACRGGQSTKLANSFDFYLEKPTNHLQPEQANFEHGKGLKRPCKVGSYKPNRLGLYDMHGNVMEWCQDEFKDDKGASLRAIRGGSFLHPSVVAWAGRRGGFLPPMRSTDFGLRLARVPIGKEIVKIPAEVKKPPLEAKPPPTFTNSLGMEFVLVPAGEFRMGSDDPQAQDREKPAHLVRITRPFYIGKYPVTVADFTRFAEATKHVTTGETMKNGYAGWGIKDGTLKQVNGIHWKNPGFEQKPQHPAVMVSPIDALAYCQWAASKTGKKLRLPTEAEWEYAARGPKNFKYPWGNDWNGTLANHADRTLRGTGLTFRHTDLDQSLRYPGYERNDSDKESDGYAYTSPAGILKNASWCGAFDMAGNAWQWCSDCRDDKYYASSPTNDPPGASTGLTARRGGSWLNDSVTCRSTQRFAGNPDERDTMTGFRIVMEAPK